MTEPTSQPDPPREAAGAADPAADPTADAAAGPAADPAAAAAGTGSRTYEVRINGSVPAGAVAEELLAELGEVEVTGQDVTTVLSGWFPDQQALAEFLRRLRGYGLEIVEIRRVASDEPASDEDGGAPVADAPTDPRPEAP